MWNHSLVYLVGASQVYLHLIGHHRFLLNRMEQIRAEWDRTQENHKGDDWFDHYKKFKEEYDGAARARASAFNHLDKSYRDRYRTTLWKQAADRIEELEKALASYQEQYPEEKR